MGKINLKKAVRIGLSVASLASFATPLFLGEEGVAGVVAAAGSRAGRGLARSERELVSLRRGEMVGLGRGPGLETPPPRPFARTPPDLAKKAMWREYQERRRAQSGGGTLSKGYTPMSPPQFHDDELQVQFNLRKVSEKLLPISRRRHLEEMPPVLQKLHGDLVKIHPETFGGPDGVSLVPATAHELEEVEHLYGEYGTVAFYCHDRREILLDMNQLTDTNFLQEVTFHESAHAVEHHQLGKADAMMEHTEQFREIHEQIWANAFRHNIVTKERVGDIEKSTALRSKSEIEARGFDKDPARYSKEIREWTNQIVSTDLSLSAGGGGARSPSCWCWFRS